MDKQQAAEREYPMPENISDNDRTTIEVFRQIYEMGWEAREAQLFTREQVQAAHSAGVIAGNKQAAGKEFQTQEEYMNTNYPEK